MVNAEPVTEASQPMPTLGEESQGVNIEVRQDQVVAQEDLPQAPTIV